VTYRQPIVRATTAALGPFIVRGEPGDDETGNRFGDHGFPPGEYVLIKEHEDVLRVVTDKAFE